MPINDLLRNFAPTIVQKEIAGVGPVRFRVLKAKEAAPIAEEKDRNHAMRMLLAASVLGDSDAPVYASPEEVEQLDWPLFKELCKAAWEVNGIATEKTEKNSPTPASAN